MRSMTVHLFQELLKQEQDVPKWLKSTQNHTGVVEEGSEEPCTADGWSEAISDFLSSWDQEGSDATPLLILAMMILKLESLDIKARWRHKVYALGAPIIILLFRAQTNLRPTILQTLQAAAISQMVTYIGFGCLSTCTFDVYSFETHQ